MDNYTKDNATNREYINLGKNADVDYWTSRFDVTKVKLKAAVNAVGPGVRDVETWLKKK